MILFKGVVRRQKTSARWVDAIEDWKKMAICDCVKVSGNIFWANVFIIMWRDVNTE